MNRNGFTLIEVVLAMMVVSISVLLYTSIVQVMIRSKPALYISEDTTSIHQMRLIYALSKDISLDGDMLQFTYLTNEMYYDLQDDKLVLHEGYQVFFMDLEDAYFTKKGDCIYFRYERKNKVQERIIGC